jgi:hypothetical protein
MVDGDGAEAEASGLDMGAHRETAPSAAAVVELANTMEEVEVVVDDSGSHVSPDLYKLRLPPYFGCILKDYLQSSGLNSLFDHCINKKPRSFLSDATFGRARARKTEALCW